MAQPADPAQGVDEAAAPLRAADSAAPDPDEVPWGQRSLTVTAPAGPPVDVFAWRRGGDPGH